MSGDVRGGLGMLGEEPHNHGVPVIYMLCSYCSQPVDLPPGHGSFHTCGHYIARLESQSCYGAF